MEHFTNQDFTIEYFQQQMSLKAQLVFDAIVESAKDEMREKVENFDADAIAIALCDHVNGVVAELFSTYAGQILQALHPSNNKRNGYAIDAWNNFLSEKWEKLTFQGNDFLVEGANRISIKLENMKDRDIPLYPEP